MNDSVGLIVNDSVQMLIWTRQQVWPSNSYKYGMEMFYCFHYKRINLILSCLCHFILKGKALYCHACDTSDEQFQFLHGQELYSYIIIYYSSLSKQAYFHGRLCICYILDTIIMLYYIMFLYSFASKYRSA